MFLYMDIGFVRIVKHLNIFSKYDLKNAELSTIICIFILLNLA